MAIGMLAVVGIVCLLADAVKEAVKAFAKPEPKLPERPIYRPR